MAYINRDGVEHLIGTGTGGGVGWAESGNNIYNINTGNVGIGTTNPQAKLDVNGTINSKGNLTIISDVGGAGTNGIILGSGQIDSYSGWIACSWDDARGCGEDTATAAGDTNNAYSCTSERTASNLVDVAKGSPSSPPGGGSLVDTWYKRTITCVSPDEPLYSIKNEGGSLKFSTNAGITFIITQDGKIGIGTTNPQAKLDVVGGKIRSDTGFCIGANCITSWPSGDGGDGGDGGADPPAPAKGNSVVMGGGNMCIDHNLAILTRTTSKIANVKFVSLNPSNNLTTDDKCDLPNRVNFIPGFGYLNNLLNTQSGDSGFDSGKWTWDPEKDKPVRLCVRVAALQEARAGNSMEWSCFNMDKDFFNGHITNPFVIKPVYWNGSEWKRGSAINPDSGGGIYNIQYFITTNAADDQFAPN